MKRTLSIALLTGVLALVAGCMRTLIDTQCPCLDGWICCETQNVCIPEAGTCSLPEDGKDDAVDRDASAPEASEEFDAKAEQSTCNRQPDVAPSMCAGGPFAFAALSTKSVTAGALIGRWEKCEGTGFLWSPADARRGIEFTADGKFFALGVDGTGALQRVSGLNSTGTYGVGNQVASEGHGWDNDRNVYIEFPEGGAATFYPSFDDAREHLYAPDVFGSDTKFIRVDESSGCAIASAQNGGASEAPVMPDGGWTCGRQPGVAPQMCAGGPFAFAKASTKSEAADAVVGRWELCEGQGFLWGPANGHRGIELTADGRFFTLGVSASGALQRVVGVRSTGRFAIARYPSSIAQGDDWDRDVYLEFPEGGSYGFLPALDRSSTHMYVEGTQSIYVRVDESSGCASKPAEDAGTSDASVAVNAASVCGFQGADAALPVCAGGPFSFANLSETSATAQAIVGLWKLCQGEPYRSVSPYADQGLEFTADGKFFVLGINARGALQRVIGLYATASYVVPERGAWAQPDLTSVDLDFPEGGATSFWASFDASRNHLLVAGDTGSRSTYVRVDAAWTCLR